MSHGVAPALGLLGAAIAVAAGARAVQGGTRARGLTVAAGAGAAALLLLWLRQPWAWAAMAFPAAAAAAEMWTGGRDAGRAGTLLLLATVAPFWAVGWVVTEIRPTALVEGAGRVAPLARSLMRPDLVTVVTSDVAAEMTVMTPCPAPASAAAPSLRPPAEAAPTEGAAVLRVVPPCAALGDTVVVAGTGFPPGAKVALTWRNPSGDTRAVGQATADAGGGFSTAITVPMASVPAPYRGRVQRQRVVAVARGDVTGIVPSPTLRLVGRGMATTVALALMATLWGSILAAPMSVLAASNLMAATPWARGVYWAVRGLMNLVRSIEPLILVVVFVVWVAQGPFAGVLALTVHSVAALGKLYSEAIEAIDPGPVEAIEATGATWMQTVVHAVVPQVVPQFIAFTVYRWDINVRMSTIIGFAGGGGIGAYLQQWIVKGRWREAATAVVVIAVVVMVLDFASARARRPLTGTPEPGRGTSARPWRPGGAPVRLAVALAAALVVAWAWRAAEVRPRRLVEGAAKIGPVAGRLLRPDLVAFESVAQRARAELLVPCGAGSEAAMAGGLEAARGHDGSSPALAFDAAAVGPGGAPCGDPGQGLRVRGRGFAAGSRGRLRWILPSGGRLGAGSVVVDAAGAFEAEVEVRPILATEAGDGRRPLALEAEVRRDLPRPSPSRPVRETAAALVVTALMAFMATSFGAAVAFPLGILGARNMMPRTLLGAWLYGSTRTFLNVVRSVEPVILGAIFASWVRYGSPFAGVLALAVVTVANLGKLFSEAVESIDPGPVEAIRATGAGWLETVAYAVVPQIVPPYLSFGMYQWDINVRMSTIIGFVGGGGIGFLLLEWIRRLQWTWASVAILGVVAVVSLMDAASASVRQRIA